MNDVAVGRIVQAGNLSPILGLIHDASKKDVPFTSGKFLAWAIRALEDPSIFVAAAYVKHEPAGFVIAFAPWELEEAVYVFHAYVKPKFRDGRVLKAGMETLKAWARACETTEITFETYRPRAWRRLLLPFSGKTKIRAEVT